MKRLFCKELAACLGMKQQSSTSLEPPLVYKNVWTVDVSSTEKDHEHDQFPSSSPEETELESIKNELKKISHLLSMRVHKEEEQRYEDDKENKMKNDWIFAAAVFDRICAIVVTAVFIVGTVVQFVMFATHS